MSIEIICKKAQFISLGFEFVWINWAGGFMSGNIAKGCLILVQLVIAHGDGTQLLGCPVSSLHGGRGSLHPSPPPGLCHQHMALRSILCGPYQQHATSLPSELWQQYADLYSFPNYVVVGERTAGTHMPHAHRMYAAHGLPVGQP